MKKVKDEIKVVEREAILEVKLKDLNEYISKNMNIYSESFQKEMIKVLNDVLKKKVYEDDKGEQPS